MNPGFFAKIGIVFCAVFAFSACRTGPSPDPVIAEAFVGPPELKIRSDLPLESSTVAVVRHGEKLEIIGHRRRLFLRVRTARGLEGWTDARQLLSKEDMEELRQLSERARSMPSQGVAITHEELRVHTEPSRGSPSFSILKENDKMDVLAQTLAPRTDTAQRKSLIPPPAPKQAVAKKPKKPPKYPPPPRPAAPRPPSNWLELSQRDAPPESEAEEEEEAPPAPPVAMDYWSLVRLRSGDTGWVLTRRLFMAIPDEVARYAEGRRIVSYFALGEAEGGPSPKYNWLWTTTEGGPQPYDFDSFRVFTWNAKRQRYETAYIERNLKGFSPVLAKQVNYAAGGLRSSSASVSGFSVCVEKADGKRYRREYAFLSTVVRFAGEGPCEAPPVVVPNGVAQAQDAAVTPAAKKEESKESLSDRLKKRIGGVTDRLLKR